MSRLLYTEAPWSDRTVDPTEEDMDWMAKRTHELIDKGLTMPLAVEQALIEGEQRARAMRERPRPYVRVMKEETRAETPPQPKTHTTTPQAAALPSLRASIFDIAKRKERK